MQHVQKLYTILKTQKNTLFLQKVSITFWRVGKSMRIYFLISVNFLCHQFLPLWAQLNFTFLKGKHYNKKENSVGPYKYTARTVHSKELWFGSIHLKNYFNQPILTKHFFFQIFFYISYKLYCFFLVQQNEQNNTFRYGLLTFLFIFMWYDYIIHMLVLWVCVKL